ncbi:Phosphoribosylaminoimidazole carboxylase like protein [Verticillium longisporum]|nr:Phosphoribosylaminoimidazole carboxylase like protein [Verticillium longisporum]
MARKPVIGLLGGGQLGRMLCEAAGPLGIEIAILDEANCPAKQANQNAKHVTGSFKDPEKIRELAVKCDVLTVEIEHINTDVLEEIATKGVTDPEKIRELAVKCDVLTVEIEHINTDVLEEIATKGVTVAPGVVKKVPVHPSWETLRLIQDKYLQKEHFGKAGIPIAPQMAIESGASMLDSLRQAYEQFGFPFMLKARKGSYDGRGNFKVSGVQDFEEAVTVMGKLPLYAEKWVPFELELAVMVVRTEDDDGQLRDVHAYPAVETIHEDSICTKVFYPPRNTPETVCSSSLMAPLPPVHVAVQGPGGVHSRHYPSLH